MSPWNCKYGTIICTIIKNNIQYIDVCSMYIVHVPCS